jgi:hypothetical protein
LAALAAPLVACSGAASSAPSESGPHGLAQDAAPSTSASDGGASADGDADDRDATPDTAIDAAHASDAGACAPCPSVFKCVLASNGKEYDFQGAEDPDGTCHFGTATLDCGGGGLTADAKPLTWSAGPSAGPNGGPGVTIDFSGFHLNCE